MQSPGHAWKPNDAITARTRNGAALVAQTCCLSDGLAGISTRGGFFVHHHCAKLVFVTEGCRAPLGGERDGSIFSTPHSSTRTRSVLSQATIPPVSATTTP